MSRLLGVRPGSGTYLFGDLVTRLTHVFLANEAETVSWHGHTLCLLCFEQFGLPQVMEEGDTNHHEIYHVVLPLVLEAKLVKEGT